MLTDNRQHCEWQLQPAGLPTKEEGKGEGRCEGRAAAGAGHDQQVVQGADVVGHLHRLPLQLLPRLRHLPLLPGNVPTTALPTAKNIVTGTSHVCRRSLVGGLRFVHMGKSVWRTRMADRYLPTVTTANLFDPGDSTTLSQPRALCVTGHLSCVLRAGRWVAVTSSERARNAASNCRRRASCCSSCCCRSLRSPAGGAPRPVSRGWGAPPTTGWARLD